MQTYKELISYCYFYTSYFDLNESGNMHVRNFIIIHFLSKELVAKVFSPIIQSSDTRNL